MCSQVACLDRGRISLAYLGPLLGHFRQPLLWILLCHRMRWRLTTCATNRLGLQFRCCKCGQLPTIVVVFPTHLLPLPRVGMGLTPSNVAFASATLLITVELLGDPSPNGSMVDVHEYFVPGLAHEDLDEVPEDIPAAVAWLRANASDDARAQNNLGVLYERGHGVAKNSSDAARWYLLAAEQGDATGQTNLASLYRRGKGVAQDFVQAKRWFDRAAEQGHRVAQAELGFMHYDGLGVAKDFAKAFDWLSRSAQQGEPIAQSQVGLMYFVGEYVEKNDVEAAAWRTRAAEQGEVSAQYALGHMYLYGLGVSADANAALQWLTLAGEKGNGYALGTIGSMFLNGKGVRRDRVTGLAYLNLAIINGYGELRVIRDVVAQSLSKKGIKEAQTKFQELAATIVGDSRPSLPTGNVIVGSSPRPNLAR